MTKKEDGLTLDKIKAMLIETLDSKLDEKLAQFKMVKDDVEQLKATVAKHGEQMEESATHDRVNNVVFYGIPYDRNEDAIDLVMEIGQSIGMNIRPEDVDIAHRLKTRNPVGPPPFIIRMVNRWKRDLMITQTRAKRPHAGLWGGDSSQQIYANEHLSPNNQEILAESRKFREFLIIWTWKGKVYGRPKLEGSQVNLIPNTETAKALVDQLTDEDKETIRQQNKEWEEKNKNRRKTVFQPQSINNRNGPYSDEDLNSINGTCVTTNGSQRNSRRGGGGARTFNRSPYRTRHRQ